MYKGGRDMKMTIKILFNNSLLLVGTRKALSEVNIKINDIKKTQYHMTLIQFWLGFHF